MLLYSPVGGYLFSFKFGHYSTQTIYLPLYIMTLYSIDKSLVFPLRYRLVPYGNHSFLECLSDKAKELPLYGSGGFRFFWDTK